MPAPLQEMFIKQLFEQGFNGISPFDPAPHDPFGNFTQSLPSIQNPLTNRFGVPGGTIPPSIRATPEENITPELLRLFKEEFGKRT
jgi:hypothetical protein